MNGLSRRLLQAIDELGRFVLLRLSGRNQGLFTPTLYSSILSACFLAEYLEFRCLKTGCPQLAGERASPTITAFLTSDKKHTRCEAAHLVEPMREEPT